jgi:hypothetical protein
VQNAHLEHGDSASEIKRLQLSERCKRKAEEDDRPLRQIFNDVCRSADADTAQSVSFSEMENAMYKRRRLAQPALPTSQADADNVVRSSRYAQLDGSEFYRGVVETAQDGTALIFASSKQLQVLQPATDVYFDATFKVVPTIYYQLLTVFVPYADSAFPVLFALMSRKTEALYVRVFEKMKELVPQFSPSSAMADFEEASVSAFRRVFGDVNVTGCWFHFAQAIIKRVHKLGLKDAYLSELGVQDTVRCLLGLPLLPAGEIYLAFDDVKLAINNDGRFASKLNDLLRYVGRQWIQKRSIGPNRLCVRDNRNRTNNVLESFHAALRRRIQVTHPNLFTFLGHLQHMTTDYMNDMVRLTNGLSIRRPKKKINIMNETRIKACVSRFDAGSYTRIQFLRAVSHSVGAHTDALQPRNDASDSDEDSDVDQQATTASPAAQSSTSPAPAPAGNCCEVCLIGSKNGVALVPCGHARFCSTCVDTLVAMGHSCPICRADIHMVMHVYN